MALTDNQLTSLESFAAARQERIRSSPVSTESMVQHLADGNATLLAEFPGSPARYLDRWWRLTDAGWEPLEETAGAAVDEDARRWALAQQAVALERS